MAISFVGAASVAGESLAMPTHQLGDRLVMFVVREGSTSSPSIPEGWVGSGSTSSAGILVQFWTRLAQSNGELSGNWTGATFLACACYRSPHFITTGQAGLFGGAAGSGGSITWVVGTPSLTPNDRWLVLGGGHRSNDTDIETPPSQYVNRASEVGASAGELCLHDSNGNTTSASNVIRNLTAGTSGNYRTIALELIETTYSISTDTAGFTGIEGISRSLGT